VPTSLGGSRTNTDVLQLTLMPRASVAEQVTGVVPGLKTLPDCGVQLRVTGAWPPDVVGELNVTGTALPFVDCASTGAAQVTVSCGTGGGAVGLDPQLAANVNVTIARSARRPIRHVAEIRELELTIDDP
jgi:hypothetical protein